MYRELQNGWIPPTELSKEEYDYIHKNMEEKPYLTGFVGFGCSFSGKWFGGYAKNKRGDNYCKATYNSLLKQIQLFKNSNFECRDYKELKPCNAIIYCDPPYQGTTQYSKQIVGEFNTYEFWNTIREWSKDNKVFISEYQAPEDFKCIWKQETHLEIRNKENKRERRVEKLFTYKNQ